MYQHICDIKINILEDLMSYGYVMWTWCTTMVSINNIFAASRYQCLEAC
nr:hypothetical protein [Tanacetum cinerariifolium]